MGYYEFTISTSPESKEAITAKLASMGSLGFSERADRIIAYFEDRHDIIKLRDELNSFKGVLHSSGLDDAFSFDYVFLSERDWNETWKKKFVPIDVGSGLSIVPPWDTKDRGRIPIIIDPGMAFGTGHHETTQTCLGLIERYARGLKKDHFLDVGTGTGILSVAASRLGFHKVTGVDTDPLAVDAAKRNAELNGLNNVVMTEGTISAAHGRFDLIAANLLSETLIRIAPEIASRLLPEGYAILSGILVGQEGVVLRSMEDAGLIAIEKIIVDRWVSLVVAHAGRDSCNDAAICHSGLSGHP